METEKKVSQTAECRVVWSTLSIIIMVRSDQCFNKKFNSNRNNGEKGLPWMFASVVNVVLVFFTVIIYIGRSIFIFKSVSSTKGRQHIKITTSKSETTQQTVFRFIIVKRRNS